MGGLGHFIEEEGIATTQISLIRVHTEKVAPPRALWVPFELGRPLGAPGDPEFQRRVLLSALNLLEAPAGPVILEDFPDEGPGRPGRGSAPGLPGLLRAPGEGPTRRAWRICSGGSWPGWPPGTPPRSGSGAGPWPTPRGSASTRPPTCSWSSPRGRVPENPRPGFDLGLVLKAAGEDLKAYYFEAMTARPDGKRSSRELNDWFWRETAASRVLRQIKEFCDNSDDKMLKLMGGFCLVPRVQQG